MSVGKPVLWRKLVAEGVASGRFRYVDGFACFECSIHHRTEGRIVALEIGLVAGKDLIERAV